MKLAVFLDVHNLFYSVKLHLQGKIDYAKLLRMVVGSRDLICANAYVLSHPEIDQRGFLAALELSGYVVRSNDIGGILMLKSMKPTLATLGKDLEKNGKELAKLAVGQPGLETVRQSLVKNSKELERLVKLNESLAAKIKPTLSDPSHYGRMFCDIGDVGRKADVICVGTSNFVFSHLLRGFRGSGKQVEILGVRKAIHKDLAKVTDRIIEIDRDCLMGNSSIFTSVRSSLGSTALGKVDRSALPKD